MKGLYYALAFLLFLGVELNAQQEISNLTLPEVGDTLRTAFDAVPPSLDLGSTGGDKTWDFSGLQGLSMETIILDASTGVNFGSFPTANQRVEVTATQEVYYNKQENLVELIGFAGDDPFGFGLQSVLTYEPARVERSLPLNFEDENSSSSRLQITIPASALPQEVLDQLPTTAIDSVKLTVDIDREDNVDAWGDLTLPAKTFGALRERRYEITNSSLEVKLGNLPWSDVTDLVINSYPELAPDTSLNYYFWGDVKEPLAIVDVNPLDETDVISVTYKTDMTTVDIPYIKRNKVDLIAYPNPAIEEVRFDFRNLNNGNYKLKIFNILGQEVWSNGYRISGNQTIIVDLEDLRKGTYLYSLVDQYEKVLTTKRLIVLRP